MHDNSPLFTAAQRRVEARGEGNGQRRVRLEKRSRKELVRKRKRSGGREGQEGEVEQRR